MRRIVRKWGRLCAVVVFWPWLAAAQQVAPAASATPPASAASVALPDIPFAAADAAAVSVPSAADAWGGERSGNEPTLSDRVVSYRIDATLDAAKHVVSGQQHMTWRNRSDRPVSKVYFHLYLNAFQNEASTWFAERKVLTAHGSSRGAAVLKKGEWGWIELKQVKQGDAALKWRFVQPDGGPATDQTVAQVELAEPVPAGGTLTLDIDFLSQLPRVVERTGWFGDFNLVAQWFPKIGVLELPGERGAAAPRWNVHEFHFNSEFYADFGLYDVRLTVPGDYTVGAVGKLQGPPETANGKSTYHFVQGDVHDFAWVAAKGYKTLDGSWQGPGSPKVDVRVIYPAEYAASAGPVLKATTDSLTYFSNSLGAYPYQTVTAVVPPYNASEAGGMEYPTFFTADGFAKVEPGTLTQYAIDFVTIHEFGHGYFYGLLASNEFEEPMLDEGMNEYWDGRMTRASGEKIVLASGWMKRLGITPAMTGFEAERLSAGLHQPPDPLGANAWDRLSSSSYGTVYSRTATAMHDLEERLGTPVLERAMHAYYRRWRFRHPSTADLRATLAEVSGNPQAVNEIFDQYVYGTAQIDDRVASIDATEVLPLAGSTLKDGKRSELDDDALDKRVDEQRKAWNKAHPNAKPGSGPFPWHSTVTVRRDGVPVPQLLRVKFADGSSEDVHWNDGRRWARFDFTRPSKVVAATLDPEQKIYLDANKLNDSRTAKADGSASRRWSADAASLLQVFYALMGSL
ncbi:MULTISPECIES: M1 family metallopeptidase [Rhodanobacter]|uniref:M1 family metallopeptidase n=1 Tax=Rhodanobacter TaxID=75309 RepID=UPI000566B51F|nr:MULTISPECIES: M1 family metallopeptidase [Rhodanobacter]KZC19863.1 peptidase M1 [Rhodanobacter denitrificans]UJJ52155.1 M1 family metallopeptidase [Rhodanobacter denitrificans]UJJ59063.1 M1 family metallopeptidase [Rhodanobacter denitrificans]UJM89529.1 M1 family metallopeptidase [Rhodanobacter denitrificans]UJM94902.1 M1 family metallopeptidase [Rhodanobacter denitrificans]